MPDCLVCGDEETESTKHFRTVCNDHYLCNECIKNAFELAMKDEKYYFPSCCRRRGVSILLAEVEDRLPADFVEEYREKEQEYSVPRR